MTRRPGTTASIKAVAARAGVSIATVSRVVNGVANKASPATVARVREAVLALDYRPTSAGRSLRQRRSRLVAVLAANLANPAMAAIAASAEIALRQRGLVMVLCDTHDQPHLQDEYLREMQAHQARAVVLLAAVASPMLSAMQGGSTPLVFVNRRAPDGGEASLFVGIDNRAAGADVAAHCLGRDLGRVAIIHGSMSSSATRERVEAMLAAFRRAGHPVPDQRILGPSAENHLVLGHLAAEALLTCREEIDAILCTSDLIAFGARRAFVERRNARPMPLLVGFDDSPLNPWIAPWLTSVRVPYDAYGAAIVDLIIGEQHHLGRDARILPHALIDRAEQLQRQV